SVAGTAAPAARDRTAGRPAERGAPAPNGRGAASDAPSTVAAPPGEDDDRGADRWLVHGLVLGALAVPVLFVLHRRRRPAVAATGSPGPSSPSSPPAPSPPTPEPDEEPLIDNVTHLPTNLNAIYELGRLDERLSQERNRRP
ncbi:hypothetical protein ACSNN9_28565, partial [Micromonospora sp. URMC 107]